MLGDEIREKVLNALDTIRPYLQADGGDIELVEVNGDNQVVVRLLGACANCGFSMQTLQGGVETVIKKAVPQITEVIAID